MKVLIEYKGQLFLFSFIKEVLIDKKVQLLGRGGLMLMHFRIYSVQLFAGLVHLSKTRQSFNATGHMIKRK